ncbi:MAG: tetratricopeptide repeat protein [Pseudomonadota bacterium]
MRFFGLAAVAVLMAMPAAAQNEGAPDTAGEQQATGPSTGSPEAILLFEKGREAMVAERYDEAAQSYISACDMGHALACGGAGAVYIGGAGVETNAPKGIEYMRKACDLNDAASCTMAGSLYIVGEVYAEAAPLVKKGCDLGDGDGCVELGRLYYSGDGIEQNVDFAGAKFAKGCSLDNADGCYTFAAFLINRDGERAVAMANIYLKKALRLDPGHEEATALMETIKPYLR